MNDRTQFGERVKAERLRRGLTQKGAAASALITHVTWRAIERGQPARDLSVSAVRRYFNWEVAGTAAVASAGSQATVVGDLVRTSVRAGRMRVLSGFGGDAA